MKLKAFDNMFMNLNIIFIRYYSRRIFTNGSKSSSSCNTSPARALTFELQSFEISMNSEKIGNKWFANNTLICVIWQDFRIKIKKLKLNYTLIKFKNSIGSLVCAVRKSFYNPFNIFISSKLQLQAISSKLKLVQNELMLYTTNIYILCF
jgi:hypothetical protein